ncbi:DUF883 domain-containing protein [Pannonibacter tanglangensis]|uniref:DUF883 domain-containing protein n=1 Tax=Pannonibacter tanglangensis TaxID=2750084 RepID=A0ABW9ZL98_9HYPH|nr:DUF883 domain-containing protein [Pannonibacter sp. XCT-34]NBN65697.1 DUF883 domain-containing protein [Pannonibacter sp. XCT-34]
MPSSVKTAADDSTSPRSPDIEDKIARIRSDIADLGKAIAGYGADKADDLKGASEDALTQLTGDLASLERELRAQVRRHPLRTVALAAGAGALVAMLARR